MVTGLTSTQLVYFTDNPELFSEPGKNKRLNIFIEPFQITATQRVGGNFIGFEQHVFEQENTEVIKNTILGLNVNNFTYDEVNVYINEVDQTILPHFVSFKEIQEILLALENKDGNKTLVEKNIETVNVKQAFFYSSKILNTLKKQYLNLSISHSFEHLCNNIGKFQERSIVVMEHQNLLEIFIVDNNKILAYNTYKSLASSDILYYLNALIHSLEIKQVDFKVIIAKKNKFLSQEVLAPYFENIEVLEVLENFSDNFTADIINNNRKVFL